MSEADKLNVDSIISRLLEGKNVTIHCMYSRNSVLFDLCCLTRRALLMNIARRKVTLSRFYLSFSSRKSARKKCTTNRGWSSRIVSQDKRNISQPAHSSRIRSTLKNMRWAVKWMFQEFTKIFTPFVIRWYTWPILWFAKTVWIWWLPSWIKLPFPWRLCRPWKTVIRNNMFTVGIQD